MAKQSQIEFPPEYPTRCPFFGFIVMKLAYKMCLATEIGGDALNLLMLVAMTEDSAHYRHPAWIWNKQARDYLGVCTDTLIAIRNRLIEAGWLHYRCRGRKKAPEYWLLIPDGIGEDERNDIGERLDQYAKLRSVDFVDSSSTDRRPIVDSSSTDRRSKVDSFYSGTLNQEPTTFPSQANADGGGVLKDQTTPTASVADDVGSRTSHSTGDRVTASALNRGDHVAPPALGMAQTATEPAQPNEIRDLATRLRALGCDLAESCLSQSMQAGYGLQEIADIVAYAEARPGFWGGGAIYRRLTRASTALPCDRGWCAPEEKAVVRLKAEAARKATEATLTTFQQPTPAVQREFDFEAAEKICGEKIDSAPLDELRIALPEFWRPKLKTRDDVQRGKPLRMALLKALAPQCVVSLS